MEDYYHATSTDAQAIAQFQLNLHLTEQSEEAAQYEIDSVSDVFGKLYRVWGGEKSINLARSKLKHI